MVTHSEVARNMLCNWITSQIDGGTLIFMTSNDVPVATLLFGNPAFADAIDGVAVANPITRDESAVGGTITKAIITNINDDIIISCLVTVVGGNGDIVLSSINVAPTQAIELSALSYQAMP
jgi:hypothetical protein